jgi:organic radical activating enzyme
VRLGRCNLDCCWCDTSYSWDWTGKNGTAYDPSVELRHMSVEAVMDAIDEAAGLLVITGGEPLLQSRGVTELVIMASRVGLDIEIETNGTRPPLAIRPAALRYNVSPKLANAQVSHEPIHPEILRAFDAAGARFKFVVERSADLDEVGEIVAACGLDPDRVWIMPQGVEAAGVAETLTGIADAVLGRGWNLTSRLHIMLWGEERGR